MDVKRKIQITIKSALLHDIGKALKPYELYNKFYGIACRNLGTKKVKDLEDHAPVGAEFLNDLGFQKEIVFYVKRHHDYKLLEKSSILKAIKKGDTLDSSARIREGKAGERDLLFNVRWNLRTLHGEEIIKVLKSGLRNNMKVSELLSILKESLSLIRADAQAPDISLFVHLHFTSAIALYEYLKLENYLTLIEIEHRALEKKMSSILHKCVEYFTGLEAYTYFGLLGAVAKTLYKLLSPFEIDPTISILYESPFTIIALIPRKLVEILLRNLKRLSSDIELPIEVKFFKIFRKNKEVIVKEVFREKINPEPHKSASGNICDYCGLLTEIEYKIDKPKCANVCEKCFLISKITQLLLSEKSLLFSLVNNVRSDAFLSLKHLNISVLSKYVENAMVTRLVNPKSARDIIERKHYPIDFMLDIFDKKATCWILIDLKPLVEAYLYHGKEWGRQKALTLANLIPTLIRKSIRKLKIRKYRVFKLNLDGVIIQCYNKTESLLIGKEFMKLGFNIIIYRGKNPGIAYRFLHDGSMRLRELWKKAFEDHILKKSLEELITLCILNFGDVKNLSINAKDIKKWCDLKDQLTVKGVNVGIYLKVIENIIDLINNYIYETNKLKSKYFLSEIMLKLTGLDSFSNIQAPFPFVSCDLLSFSEILRDVLVKEEKSKVIDILYHIPKLDYYYKLNFKYYEDFYLINQINKYFGERN